MLALGILVMAGGICFAAEDVIRRLSRTRLLERGP